MREIVCVDECVCVCVCVCVCARERVRVREGGSEREVVDAGIRSRAMSMCVRESE